MSGKNRDDVEGLMDPIHTLSHRDARHLLQSKFFVDIVCVVTTIKK